MKAISHWRTAIIVLAMAVIMLVGLLICVHAPDNAIAAGTSMFIAFAGFLVGLAGVQGGKSVFEHAADGKGFAGVKRVLMTDEKPTDPSPPVQP